MGMYGISVMRKMRLAGIAIRKLNAMAAALSLRPSLLDSIQKYRETSYKEIDLKPGR
jgi:hypothetical protein